MATLYFSITPNIEYSIIRSLLKIFVLFHLEYSF